MSETVSLHIQASDSGQIRVVELSGSTARIGRSASCEVQIADPALAQEQCLLLRRGTGGSSSGRAPGAVWVGGRRRAGQRLSPDAPFRVGDHWLTLHRSEVTGFEWGSFQTPIPVGIPPSPAPASAGFRAEAAEGRGPKTHPGGEATPPEGSGPEAEAERLSRWEALREQREHWRGARQEEKRWEERWRAAGESLRARSGPQTSRPVTSPATPLSTGPDSPGPFRSPRTPPREGVPKGG
ncbi:MAG: FHA domain-containing protein [Singulisphaera sp.]